MTRRLRLCALLTTLVAGLTLASNSVASAAPTAKPSVQAQIDIFLKSHPTARQTAPDQVQLIDTPKQKAMMRFGTDAISDCPAPYSCWWEHINFEGQMLGFFGVCGQTLNLFEIGWNDRISSSWNRDSISYQVDDTDPFGTRVFMFIAEPGFFSSDWRNLGANDRADWLQALC